LQQLKRPYDDRLASKDKERLILIGAESFANARRGHKGNNLIVSSAHLP